MRLKITIELWQKEAWCIAKIPELDFVAQGKTIEEAKSNLIEVVRIQLAEMKEMGTFEDYLAECGFVIKDDTIEPENEILDLKGRWYRLSDAEDIPYRLENTGEDIRTLRLQIQTEGRITSCLNLP